MNLPATTRSFSAKNPNNSLLNQNVLLENWTTSLNRPTD
jgi:hypothetical protein